jgi:hypothetical protein
MGAIRLWKRDTKNWEVRQVTGELYPGRDSEGDSCYENTHFLNEDDAWASLRAEAEAVVSLSAGNVENAKQSLLRANAEAGEAVIIMTKVIGAIGERKRVQEAQE